MKQSRDSVALIGERVEVNVYSVTCSWFIESYFTLRETRWLPDRGPFLESPYNRRLDYQPLFGNMSPRLSPEPISLLGKEPRPDTRERRKSSL